jgi:V/A-type H+-transporting ATPase subunit I
VFGVLYGEFFGLHQLGEILFDGSPPIHKGLQPKYEAYATGWMLASLVVGLGHVTLGYALGFVKTALNHDPKEAILEKGSWVLLMAGFWVWLFSTHTAGSKPDFIFTVFSAEGATTISQSQPVAADQVALALGFTGLPETVGLGALAVAGLGFVLLVIGEGLLAIEFLQAIVSVLSYVRLMAVLLAKAGMAFVVNLLVLGAVETESGEFHFIAVEGYADPATHGEVMFPGLFNLDGGATAIVGLLAGVLLLVIGHLFVLALGVTSAGLQAVRLEYVEFFGKFYDGGGRSYDPFGYDRQYTTED